VQEVLGCFQERLAYREEPMEDLTSEREIKMGWNKKGLYSALRKKGKTVRKFPTGKDPEKKRLFGETRYCPHCEAWKDTYEFDWKREGKPGNYTRIKLQVKCARCRRKQQIKKYSSDPHSFVFRRIQLILQPSASRKNGRRKSKLTIEEFMNEWMQQFNRLGLRCPKTRQLMTYTKGSGEVLTNISVDRINSTGDYEKGNVQFVCLAYNTMKNKYPEHVLMTWCQRIVKNNEME